MQGNCRVDTTIQLKDMTPKLCTTNEGEREREREKEKEKGNVIDCSSLLIVCLTNLISYWALELS